MIKCFDFDIIFLGWFRDLFALPRISFLVNQSPRGYFSCSRGIQHKDPLSPLLFCILEDFLGKYLGSMVDNKHFRSILSLIGIMKLTHCLYDNDLLIFDHICSSNFHALSEVPHLYGCLSE